MWDKIWDNIVLGSETEKIEFKETIDLGNRQAKAEFARDISAIANTEGEEGYLVIGRNRSKTSQRKSTLKTL